MGQIEAVAYDYLGREAIVAAGNVFQDYEADVRFVSDADSTYVELSQNELIALPQTLPERWNAFEPLQLAMRFKFVGDETCCDASNSRPVLASNPGDQRDVGFSLKLELNEGQFELILYVGEGIYGTRGEGLGAGYRFTLASIIPDQWVDLQMVFRLSEKKPRIESVVDGVPSNSF